ncbi:hypothetical protein LTR10_008849 [Elasticomyces elasticus]|nr:hypothetical protein LTR10_008849 [Elasticomyces elasticus]KAK4974180.1 hypothetical protein LTR42_004819 [Elasticomyces elasticus]
MPSKFYAASGVAYTTPTAFFEPNQGKPDVLHPALRPRGSSQRVRKTSSNEPTVKDRETCEAVHDMLRRHRQFKVYNRASPAKSNDEPQLEIQSAPRGSFSSAKPVKPIPSGSGKYPPRVESLQSSPPSKPIPVRDADTSRDVQGLQGHANHSTTSTNRERRCEVQQIHDDPAPAAQSLHSFRQ